MKRYHAFVGLRTCHDIRKLVVCGLCSGVGNKIHMLRHIDHGHVHGRCFISEYGLSAFLKLPNSAVANLRLDDIGVRAMKAIVGRAS